MAQHPMFHDDARLYTPQQPTGGRCPHCGTLVLVKEWRDGVYSMLSRPLTLALGAVHMCDTREEEQAG